MVLELLYYFEGCFMVSPVDVALAHKFSRSRAQTISCLFASRGGAPKLDNGDESRFRQSYARRITPRAHLPWRPSRAGSWCRAAGSGVDCGRRCDPVLDAPNGARAEPNQKEGHAPKRRSCTTAFRDWAA